MPTISFAAPDAPASPEPMGYELMLSSININDDIDWQQLDAMSMSNAAQDAAESESNTADND